MSGPSAVDFYRALADAVDVSDLTSNEGNADLLRRLKSDDPGLTQLWLSFEGTGPQFRSEYDFVPEDARAMGVLGHYVGRSTNLTELCVTLPGAWDDAVVEPFLLGLESNRSIERLWLAGPHIPCDFSRMLTPFIRANPSLESLRVAKCDNLDVEQYRSLSLALGEGKSLKEFSFGGGVGRRLDHEESITANIEALKMHPQLERLSCQWFAMGINVCAALADLLRQSAGMQKLYLSDNDIDDSGVEALVDGLAHCRDLQELNLSRNPAITVRGWRAFTALLERQLGGLHTLTLDGNAIDDSELEILMGGLAHCRGLEELFLPRNPSITVRGWRSLAAVLEDPNSSLKKLNLYGCGIGDEGATIFANALARNNSLEGLSLHSFDAEEIAGESWKEAFAEVLCDTSSLNSTFLSNHTLRYLTGPGGVVLGTVLPNDLASSLRLNQRYDKQAVAIRKILLHHDDFDMQPFFEWDLKALPFVVRWFDRADTYRIECKARRLSGIYQFVRGMPELAIEGISRVNSN